MRIQRSGGANAADLFSASGSLGPLTQGAALTVDGSGIGTVTQNSGGTLLLTFAPGATTSQVQQAMRGVACAFAGDAPPGSVALQYTLNDGNTSGDQGVGGALTGTAGKTVSITRVNDAPSFVGLDGTPDYTEDAAPVVLDSNATLADPELVAANAWSAATLALARQGGANAEDVFGATGTLGSLTQGGTLVVGGVAVGTVTQNAGGALLLTFGANATNARVDAVLQQITYRNTSQDPPAGAVIAYTVNDRNTGAQGIGGALTGAGSVAVRLLPVNDAPVAANDAAGLSEDAAAPLTGDVRANDTDVDDPRATLAVTGFGPAASAPGGGIATAYGTLTMRADGTWSYVLDTARPEVQGLRAGQSLTDGASYTLSDPDGLTSTVQLVVTITGANDPPVAADDAATVAEDAAAPVAGSVRANDTDADHPTNSLAVTQVNGAAGGVGAPVSGAYGTVTIAADGAYSYTLRRSDPAVQVLRDGEELTDAFT